MAQLKKVFIEMEKLKNLHSGLGQFCLNLGQEYRLMEPSNLDISIYAPAKQNQIFGSQFKYIPSSPLHRFLPLQSKEFDIWHCVHQDSAYWPTSKKTKVILTIHDLNFLEKYGERKRQHKLTILQKKINRATAITVISKYTEKMVRQNLNLNHLPVQVIPNGNSLKVIDSAGVPDFITFSEFIFSIGILSAKKNFHSLLPLLQHNKNLNLVLAGNKKSSYATDLVLLAEKLGVRAQLHLPGTINDAQKYWLYKNCKAFVFPSLTEGFGLPVVEAMSLGKPVFLANRTSLPEVGGDIAFYWETFDALHMQEVFQNGMAIFNSVQEQKSIQWAAQFSWKNAASAYLKLYSEI